MMIVAAMMVTIAPVDRSINDGMSEQDEIVLLLKINSAAACNVKGYAIPMAAAAIKAPACLLVLSGLPGSGKTTLARAIAQEAEQHGIEVRHVCFDDYGCQPAAADGGSGSDATEAPFSPEAWQLARKAALDRVQADLCLAGSRWKQQDPRGADGSSWASPSEAGSQLHLQHSPRRRLVIADDNMQYKSMRGQCHTLARAAAAAIVLLHVQCSEQLAQQQNAARPMAQQVMPATIRRMAARFEEPGSGDGKTTACGLPENGRGSSSSCGGSHWEPSCLIIRSSKGAAAAALDAGSDVNAKQQQDQAAALWQRIWQLWGSPAPAPHDAEAAAAARAAAQAATSASRVHAADVATRHTLSRCMRLLGEAASQQSKAAAAQRLNAARRQLLQQVQATEDATRDGGSSGAGPSGAEHWAAHFQKQCDAILAAL